MSAPPAPPAGRASRLWRRLDQAAREGVFRLPVCPACGQVQYPPQDFCRRCLGAEVSWEQVTELGAVLSWTTLHVSQEPFFKDKLPLHLGLVKLDCGPVLMAYLAAASRAAGARVQLSGRLDRSGRAVFFAMPPGSDPASEFNALLQEEQDHGKH